MMETAELILAELDRGVLWSFTKAGKERKEGRQIF